MKRINDQMRLEVHTSHISLGQEHIHVEWKVHAIEKNINRHIHEQAGGLKLTRVEQRPAGRGRSARLGRR